MKRLIDKIKEINWKPLTEAIKELLRVVLLAILPLLIVMTEEGIYDPRLIKVVGLLAALRFLDKWLHEEGKVKGDKNLEKGLTRF